MLHVGPYLLYLHADHTCIANYSLTDKVYGAHDIERNIDELKELE